MLKKRIAATLIVKDGIVVQSIRFKNYLPVGKPAIAIEYLNQWGIDEIILLDISASYKNAVPDYSMIKTASKKCFVPLTVGGGITDIEQMKELLHCGADKVSLNQVLLYKPELITEAALLFGNQCIVASLDAVKTDTGYKVFDYLKKMPLEINPAHFAKELEERGAGEVLINSVDRDGSYHGYDIQLINQVCEAVTVPVICCGGAKSANDFIQAFSETKVCAASAANFYHFTEHSVNCTKTNVLKQVPVRLETYANYSNSTFDGMQRLLKKTDKELEEMLFVKTENEVI
jgi:cyclase